LQYGFEMSWRQPVTRGKRLCGDRLSLRPHCNINDGRYREDSFAREERHAKKNVPQRELVRSPLRYCDADSAS
jgi:hypothetical protein